MPWFWSSLAPFSSAIAALARIRATPPPDDAFLDRRTGGMQGVFDARLLSFISTSVAAPTLITATPPGQLGHALLQLLAVVVRGGLPDLRLDLLDAGFDVRGVAGAVDDGGVLLRDPAPSSRGRGR